LFLLLDSVSELPLHSALFHCSILLPYFPLAVCVGSTPNSGFEVLLEVKISPLMEWESRAR